jgi:dihydroorotase
MLFIKNATIIHAGKKPVKADVLVKNGVIEEIGQLDKVLKTYKVVDLNGAVVMPGWTDIGVHACDPGFEHREDLDSVVAAAKAGGFATIAVMPDTDPCADSKAQVRYVLEKTAQSGLEVLPIGALSVHIEGKDMAELMDMHQAGAVAFTDGQTGTQDAGLLLRVLQYSAAFGGLIMNHPHHKSIAREGQMHEGVMSTSLGMMGLPVLAETLMVQRDLSILAYAGGRLHFHLISSSESVDLIRNAKAQGLQVTCSVAIANLCFTDQHLAGFESKFKVLPPLRDESDRQALIAGLKDGTIDCISTAHTPWHIEAKDLEFPYAEFGMTGLETAFSMCQMYLAKDFSISQLSKLWSDNPRKILGLKPIKIEKGTSLSALSIFDQKTRWQYNSGSIRSKSTNHPLFGTELIGKAVRLIGY